MRTMRVGSVLLATAVTASVWAGAAPEVDPEAPGDHLLLVQSELDYLPAAAAGKLVTVRVDDVEPGSFLEALRKASGLDLPVRGSLPKRPLLSASFRDAPTKDVLVWLAQQLPVTYKVEQPKTVWIIVDVPQDDPKPGAAG
jgi:hypothetical protein